MFDKLLGIQVIYILSLSQVVYIHTCICCFDLAHICIFCCSSKLTSQDCMRKHEILHDTPIERTVQLAITDTCVKRTLIQWGQLIPVSSIGMMFKNFV